MCQLCGCTEYTKQGKEAVLGRAVKIVGELGLTPDNVDDYEEIEIISRFIAPFGSVEDDVYQTAKHIATPYHQLEQLSRELDEADLASVDPEVRRAIEAVNRVHDGLEAKEVKLRQRYGL